MNHTKVAVIGSLNMDIVVETPRHPQVGETLLGDRVRFMPGGKGANQAVAAARLGAKALMIGAVGDDAFGLELLSALERDGVDVTGVKRLSGTATGIASIYVSEGDNSIVAVPGASGQVQPEDIDRNAEKLEQADIVLLQLEIPVETALYAARKAKELGKTVVLNPAPAQPLPEELFRCADFVTPNRTELSGYTGIAADGNTLGSAMRRLQELGAAHVVTTLGAGGSAYLDGNGEVRLAMGHPVQVVDTTGAGDCFNAALAVSIAQGRSLREAVEYAALASALAVTKFGAQAGMPTEEEVRLFAAERNVGG
ncbi:ribokinase [Paenibacillus macerans]|uniref:ribokinase n=1 Tax=Paenibacillus macerans TaxID=44252 RepID=UPI0020413480|nr:ribokinase [Paenibacillus macerans]MCM3701460.1 ribokinase [Paenibacillus macerans]